MTSGMHDISGTGPHSRVQPSRSLPRRAGQPRHARGIGRPSVVELAREHADLDALTPVLERLLLGGKA